MIGKVMKNFCLITFEIWGELCGIYTTLNTVTNTFLLSLSQCFLQVSNKSVTALSSGNQGKGKTAIFKRWCMSILLYSVFTHEGTETHMNHWLERVELLLLFNTKSIENYLDIHIPLQHELWQFSDALMSENGICSQPPLAEKQIQIPEHMRTFLPHLV